MIFGLEAIQIGTHVILDSISLVTSDVSHYLVTAGNSAKIIKQYKFETKQWEQPKK